MKKVALSIHANNNFSINNIKHLKGLDYIHVDVMDGKFVESKNLNLEVFQIIKNHINLPIIAHMMVQYPSKYINNVINFVDFYLFHFEVKEDKLEIIKKVKTFHKKVGIVLNPETHISDIEFLLKDIDIVLILGVKPGWSGQQLIPETIKKLNNLAKYKGLYNFLIDIDGGVTLQNAPEMINTDILTSSSFILNAKDPNYVIKKLKEIN
ncbi:MAG: ribulose-phosphate 3-epimerase [Promethearchaeota archaeon]